MKKSTTIPSDILHHDAMNHPIRVGDYILVRQSSRSWNSPFLCGKVTELIMRGGQAGIRFLSCFGERRQKYTSQTNPSTPSEVSKSSTIKLDTVVVVTRDTISPRALGILTRIEEVKESVSDTLKFVDEL